MARFPLPVYMGKFDPVRAGNYVVTAVLTLSDGQKVTHAADLRVV